MRKNNIDKRLHTEPTIKRTIFNSTSIDNQ